MPLDKQQILQQLRTVRDPVAGGDILAQDRVRNVAYCDGFATIRLDGGVGDAATQQKLREVVTAAVKSLSPEVKQVTVEYTSAPAPAPGMAGTPAAGQQRPAQQPGTPPSPQQTARAANPLPNVRHIVAVGAGKGGVGKSTVAINLAVGLARRGLAVGLLDGDIYGPSAPTLLGLADKQLMGSQQTLFPFEVHGIKAMTIGKMVDAEKPLIWRGPMAHGAFQQITMQTQWGPLDYLIIDLPPGTGDVPLTMSQLLPLSGAVIVCTPQKVAQDDAVRAAGMFRQLNIPVLGVVENMSYFIGDDGKEYDIFGKGGAAEMARRLSLPVLGQIPIHMELRRNSDAGNPTANFTGNPQLTAELMSMTDNVIEQVNARSENGGPTLTVR